MTDLALATPGVYVRAVETDVPPASRSALTGFVGVAERGPVAEPQFVRSYGDFETVFGGIWGFGSLAPGLYAYFLNGGEEACVVRAARPALTSPPGPGTVVEDVAAGQGPPLLDADGNTTLRFAARSPGSWSRTLEVDVGSDAVREMDLARLRTVAAAGTMDLFVDATCDFRQGGKVSVRHAGNPFLRSTHVIDVVDHVQRKLTLLTPLPREYPRDCVVSGAGFRLAASDGKRREVFDGLSMNPDHPRHCTAVVNGPSGASYLALAGAGHSLLVVLEQLFAPGGEPLGRPAIAAGLRCTGGGDGVTHALGALSAADASPSLRFTAKQPGHAGNDLRIVAEAFRGTLALPVPQVAGLPRTRLVLLDIAGWTAGDTVRLPHATNPALDQTAVIAQVIPAEHALILMTALATDHPIGAQASVDARFTLHVSAAAGDARESFPNLSMSAGPRFVADVLSGAADPAVVSKLVWVETAGAGAKPPVGSVLLDGGTDPDEMPLTEYTGYERDGSVFVPASGPRSVGLATLESVPEVSLVSLPDLGTRQDLSLDDYALASSLALLHCRKLGERLALLDGPPALLLDQIHDWPSRFTDGGAAKFGALYWPWLRFRIGNDSHRVPPSTAVAGLMARSDAQDGIGRAPGNLALKGATETEVEIQATEQGALNLLGVNCIRKFEVGALRLWGARTLSREREHVYVHHRRVVLSLVKALGSGLRWAVFEPNDALLRKRLADSLEGVLRGMLARGLTAGRTPAESFYVKVNEPDLAAEGQVSAEIGIAVAKPAEFVVVAVRRSPDILTLVEVEA
jgi:hypothetical protein